MARTRKAIQPLNLYKYDVLIEDKGTRSDYFKITQFDGYFYGGRNAFLIAGASILKANSKILVEILNVNGETVYSAPVANFIEGNSRLVQVEVYNDTPIGPGKIVVLGSAETYLDGTPIPAEWKDKYNVRWVADVIISPRVNNKAPIRFVNTPIATVEEKFYPIPVSASFSQSISVGSGDYELTPITYNTVQNGYLIKLKNPTTQNVFTSEQLGGSLQSYLAFSGSSEFIFTRLPITRILNSTTAESRGRLITSSLGTVISKIYSSGSGFNYTSPISPYGEVTIFTSSNAILYDKLIENNTDTENTSFAKLRISNLSTISGEVNKIRVSYKVTTEPGDFLVLGDVSTRVEELLSIDSGSKIVSLGQFDKVNLDDYWYAATMSLVKNEATPTLPIYYRSSSLSTNLPLLRSSDVLLNSLFTIPQIENSTYKDNTSYFIGTRKNALVNLLPNSEYTLKLSAVYTALSASIVLNQPDSSVEIYLVKTEGSSGTLLEIDPRGQLLGTLTPLSSRQLFEDIEFNFKPKINKPATFGLRFVVYGGFWNFSNISVKVAEETFFSPDEVTLLVPTINRSDELLTFKTEFLDIDNNSSNIVATTIPTIFTGSSDYVKKTGDYMTGELYINALPIQQQVLQDSFTGLINGGVITVNSPASWSYTISSGSGYVIDNYTNALNPTYTYVTWSQITKTPDAFPTVGSIASYPRTNIAISASGQVIEQSAEWTTTDYRKYIVLGRIAHVGTTFIQRALSLPLTTYNRGFHWFDLANAIGIINVEGNIYYASGSGMSIGKTSGKTYRIGSNYRNDTKFPDITTDASSLPVTFSYRYRSGSLFAETPLTTIVTGSLYDNGTGTLATVNPNKFTVQRIYYFGATNTTRIQFGQNEYNTMVEAQDAAASEQFTVDPNLERDSALRAYLIIDSTTTNLSDPTHAEFIPVGKFGSAGGSGGGGGGGASTLAGLTDVSLTGLASGQYLRYNGTSWVNSNLTGSLFGTSSWASNAISSSFTTTSSFASTASYAVNADLLDGLNSTIFATTGSNVFIGNQSITGSLILSSSLPVELRVIGDVEITGSLRISGSLFGTSSFAQTASNLTGGTANYIPLWTSATAQSSSNITQNAGNIVIGTDPGSVELLRVGGSIRASGNSHIVGAASSTTAINRPDNTGRLDIGGGASTSATVGARAIFQGVDASAGSRGTLTLSAGILASPSAGEGTIYLQTSGSNRVTITPTGEVGVGVLVPQRRLHVDTSGSDTTQLALTSINSSNRVGILFASSSLGAGKQHSLFHRTNANLAEWLMGASATETATWILLPQDNSNFGLYFTVPRDGGISRIYGNTNQVLSLGANAVTDILYITGSGNVGIGTTSPLTKLDVRSGYITVGTDTSTMGTRLLAGYYSAGAITTLGTEQSSGGPVLGYAVWPSSSAGSFISATSITAGRTAYALNDSTHRWYAGASQTAAIGNPVTLTEIMRLSSNGSLGIGTTSSGYTLDVQNSLGGTLARFKDTDSVYNGIIIAGDTNAGWVGNGASLTNEGIYYQNSINALRIYTSGSERVRIDASGSVGIGTTAPSAKLTVLGNVSVTTAGRIGFYSENDTFTLNGYTTAHYGLTHTNTILPVVLSGYYGLEFVTTGTSRMIISSSGNVGIGTTNPLAKLHVEASVAAASTPATTLQLSNNQDGGHRILFTNAAASTFAAIDADIESSGAGTDDSVIKFWTATNGSMTEKVRIDKSGNVGVGTLSPAYKLDVIGTARIGQNSNSSTAARLEITAGGSTFDSIVDFGFYETFDASVWNIGRKGSTGAFFISNFGGGPEVNAVTIKSDSSSNVGIGTTNPQTKLDVNGTIAIGGRAAVTGSATYTQLLRADGPVGIYLGGSDTANYYDNSTHYFRDRSNNTRMFIDGTGGKVGIGTTSPATTLHVAGGMARTNTRVSSDEVYPVGHYTPGETVFEINTTWTDAELQEYFNSSNVAWTSSADAPGGYAIYINGAVDVGGEYNSGFPYIPVDQDDVFYMECWIRNVGTNQAHYMGSIDYNHNLTSIGGNPGTYGYWVMSNTNPTTTWTKVSGYIKGFGTSTGQFVVGTKYWTPQALFNYTAGTGTRACVISGWKVIKVNAMGNRFFSGNVGIGTTSPAWKLDVNGSIGLSGSRFAVNSGNYNIIYEPAGNPAIYLGNATDPSNYYDNTAHWWRTRGGGTVNMYLNSVGLGLGATTPLAKLDVRGSILVGTGSATNTMGATNYIAISTPTIGQSTGLEFYGAESPYNPRAWITHTHTVSSQALTFNSTFGVGTGFANFIFLNGNVGIGTTSPVAKLDVSGSDGARIVLIAGQTKATRIGANSAGAIIEGVDYTGVGSYQPLYVGGSTVTLTTSNVDRWVVNASGHLVAATDNTYDIGAAGTTRPRNVFVAGNISASGSLSVSGSTYLRTAIEHVIGTSSAPPTTLNYNVLDGAILFHSASTSANWTLNFRGNASTTLNSVMPLSSSLTVTLLTQNGATPYSASLYQIDGTSITPRWQGGISGSGNADSLDAHTFTIIKISNVPTYLLLGSITKYT